MYRVIEQVAESQVASGSMVYYQVTAAYSGTNPRPTELDALLLVADQTGAVTMVKHCGFINNQAADYSCTPS